MRAAACLMAVVVAGCSSPAPMGPTPATSQAVAPRVVETVAMPVVSGVTGPVGCVDQTAPVADLVWLIQSRDDLILAVHHDDAPGCAPTTANGRYPGLLTLAVEPALPLQRVTYPRDGWASWADRPCGRVQVDIESRTRGLLVGMVVTYGVGCVRPVSPRPETPAPCPLPTKKGRRS